MPLKDNISNLRTSLKLSQSAFAEMFGVSQQTVQKWESGASVPTLENLAAISKRFGVSLDSLVMDMNIRATEELSYHKSIRPDYTILHPWELFSENLLTEYQQAIEEGADIAQYKGLFEEVSKIPRSPEKKKISDTLFDIVLNAPKQKGYKYEEPSTLPEIRALRKPYSFRSEYPDEKKLRQKILGAWFGRICGCMLGKPVEGATSDDLKRFLTFTDNYPLSRYILRSDFTDEDAKQFRYCYASRPYVDVFRRMPCDDDTNYTILYQELISRVGKNFTSDDVLSFWVDHQPKNAYCTAERVAFCNFIKGYAAPASAMYQNPYREWIGAQIRADYFGYINPGNPEKAAEMAFRDASISHVKNGIYGEMFVAAMLAAAAVSDSIRDIINAGLAEIPCTSRLYEKINEVIRIYDSGVTSEQFFADFHRTYNECISHNWCHTITNAMIVVACLLYGNEDYGRSICMAVQTGFDTDCNGATVGSILGMKNGYDSIGEKWTAPINNTLDTSIFGIGTVKITDRVELTLAHIK